MSTQTTETKQTEKLNALDTLRRMIRPGRTIYTVVRHTSASGMSKSISLHVIEEGEIIDISPNVARVTGYTFDRNHGRVKAGDDNEFEAVYSLGYALYPMGHHCAGDGCPSNEHVNGDRNYKPEHMHRDGVYALKQRSI